MARAAPHELLHKTCLGRRKEDARRDVRRSEVRDTRCADPRLEPHTKHLMSQNDSFGLEGGASRAIESHKERSTATSPT